MYNKFSVCGTYYVSVRGIIVSSPPARMLYRVCPLDLQCGAFYSQILLEIREVSSIKGNSLFISRSKMDFSVYLHCNVEASTPVSFARSMNSNLGLMHSD
jgi:hypothetical protein